MYFKQKHKELLSYIPVACLMMYFLVILCVYTPNMGGGGLQLPQNILCWLVMLLVIFLAGCYVVFVKELKWNLSFVIFIMGSFLLSLPLLWGDSEVQRYAFLRFAGLWGGVLFYFALLQFSFTLKLKRYLIVTIALSAIIQVVIASIQVSLTSPDNIFEFIPGTRPYGIFQQVNVLASFVATGYACAVWLLFRSKNWYYSFLLLVLIAFFSVALDALQSRAGFYGAIIYTLFIFGSGFRPREKI
ncbi:pilin glycosylation ligase domain-containing protein [Huaxiibacter chinensis]